MKSTFAIATDAVFCLAAGFCLAFIIINYYMPRPASYVLATTVAIIFTLFTLKISILKRDRKFSVKEREKAYENFITYLNVSEEKVAAELFDKAVKSEGFLTEKKRGGIFIPETNTTMFFRFGFDGVSKTDVVKCFNKISKYQKAEIFSETFSNEVKAFASRFGGKIILTDGKAAFLMLEKHNLLPQNTFNIKEAPSEKVNFARLFDKKRAKNFLVFGLLFTFLSFFAPIKIYYLIFGAVFSALAVITRLFGKTA